MIHRHGYDDEHTKQALNIKQSEPFYSRSAGRVEPGYVNVDMVSRYVHRIPGGPFIFNAEQLTKHGDFGSS